MINSDSKAIKDYSEETEYIKPYCDKTICREKKAKYILIWFNKYVLLIKQSMMDLLANSQDSTAEH